MEHINNLLGKLSRKAVQGIISYEAGPEGPPVCPGFIIHQPLRPYDKLTPSSTCKPQSHN